MKRKVFIGLSYSLITIVLLLVLLVYFVVFGGPAKRIKDIDKYTKIFELNSLQSGLAVFPESVILDKENTVFNCKYRDTLFDPTVEIFLQCDYDEEAFNKEIERLENYEKTVRKANNKFEIIENERFVGKTFIAVDHDNYSYEYAIVSGDKEITYIYLAFMKKDKIRFDEKYLPKDYGVEKEEAFTIYSDGHGYSEYTRE